MANPLLERALPAELAERGQVFDLALKIADFPRLDEIAAKDLAALPGKRRPRGWRDAPVEVRLEFGWADGQKTLPALEGSASARIAAVCQRCLEPFELPASTTLSMVLLGADDAAGAAGDAEVWELDGPDVRPLDIVEEALIMSLPLAAMHDGNEDCGPLAGDVAAEESDTVRPFADLRSMMNETEQ